MYQGYRSHPFKALVNDHELVHTRRTRCNLGGLNIIDGHGVDRGRMEFEGTLAAQDGCCLGGP